MKKLRCHDGDIAIVIHDEAGREANLGRFVWVYGPPRVHPELGVVWGIAAARTEALLPASDDRVVGKLVLQPDAWLLSVRCRRVRHLRPARADMIAKLGRESLRRIIGREDE